MIWKVPSHVQDRLEFLWVKLLPLKYQTVCGYESYQEFSSCKQPKPHFSAFKPP